MAGLANKTSTYIQEERKKEKPISELRKSKLNYKSRMTWKADQFTIEDILPGYANPLDPTFILLIIQTPFGNNYLIN
jgi:hypothetical protein